jgi:hypothetical protein
MSLKTLFERLAGMAGVIGPEAGARLLHDHLRRVADARRSPGEPGDPVERAAAEIPKWFQYYRRRETPTSIASYMMAVEAHYRAAGASRRAGPGH